MSNEAPSFPEGEYAKVEMMGHRTLWGRVSEIERFGTKMCQVEPIYCGKLLPPILTTGSSIYCFTPVSAETAFGMAPSRAFYGDDTLRLLAAPAAAIKDKALEVDTDRDGAFENAHEEELPL